MSKRLRFRSFLIRFSYFWSISSFCCWNVCVYFCSLWRYSATSNVNNNLCSSYAVTRAIFNSFLNVYTCSVCLRWLKSRTIITNSPFWYCVSFFCTNKMPFCPFGCIFILFLILCFCVTKHKLLVYHNHDHFHHEYRSWFSRRLIFTSSCYFHNNQRTCVDIVDLQAFFSCADCWVLCGGYVLWNGVWEDAWVCLR